MKNSLKQSTVNGPGGICNPPAKTSHLASRVYHSLLVTMMLTTLAFIIAMIIDTLITGNVLGSVALAAAGVASPVYLVPMTVVGVLQIGSVALIMRYLGMEKIQTAVDLFTMISVLCVIIGVALTFIFGFFADPIAVFLGAKGEVIPLVSDYIKGLSLGMIPILIGQYLLFMVRIDGHSKLCLVCVLIIAAVNVALDLYFSIVLKWGMFGMALATSISNGVGAIICIVPFLRKRGMFRFKFYRAKREHGVIANTFTTGLPTAAVRLSNLIFIIVVNNLLFVEEMVAYNLQNSVSSLNATIYSGIGQTVAVMVSLYYGEKDKRSIKDTMKISLKSGVIIGACSAVVFIVFAQTVVRMFAITDPQIADMCMRASNLFMIGLPVHVAMYSIVSFYQSVEKPILSSVLTSLFLMVMPLVCIFTLRPFVGNNAIWFSLTGGSILTLLILPFSVRIISKKFPKNMDDYMMLTIPKLPIFLRSMKANEEEISSVSKEIVAFCLLAGVDQQSSTNTAFAMQEMTKNVISHGFGNIDTHYVDIRVVVNPETILVRIRDNAPAFDPVSHLTAEGEKASATGGIHRVNGIAQQIDYKNIIGMNCLLVTISRNSVAR